jgi:hypothetical protein
MQGPVAAEVSVWQRLLAAELLDRKLTWSQQDVAGKNKAGMTPKTVYRVSYQ